MGIVAKFTGGKRINFSTGGSFKRRCFGAGLSHSCGPSWHFSPWRRLHRSPGTIFKTKILAREKRRFKRRLAFSDKPSKKRRRIGGGNYDSSYGPDVQSPDIDEAEMAEKSQTFLAKLSEEIAMNPTPEIETIGQHCNQLWHEKRVNRLTASKFGAVVKRLPHTSCHNMVKSVLYPKNLNSEAVLFGRDNEDKVIQMYEKRTSNKVNKCGLFVDTDHPFLGASPDGLVSFDGLVEVKCLASVKEFSFKEEVENKKKDFCLQFNECGELQLKRNHNYYFQIQGQLNITKRLWCDFVVYSKKGELFVERINKDDMFWKTTMLPKLTQFYRECMLPEIVDSRVVRGMRIREPKYILDAQEKVARQKEEKSDVKNLKRKTQAGAKQKKINTDIV